MEGRVDNMARWCQSARLGPGEVQRASLGCREDPDGYGGGEHQALGGAWEEATAHVPGSPSQCCGLLPGQARGRSGIKTPRPPGIPKSEPTESGVAGAFVDDVAIGWCSVSFLGAAR